MNAMQVRTEELETSRLKLRKLVSEDAEVLFRIRTDENVTKYVNPPGYKEVSDALRFIRRVTEDIKIGKVCFWGIALQYDDQLIGTICLFNVDENKLRGEVGFDLLPEFQDQGYASEALEAVHELGYKMLRLGTLEAYTHVENASAIKLLLKHGYKKFGEVEEDGLPMGIYEKKSEGRGKE
jgi:ribosomal-protein-alanine N-acetyltransferase